MLATVYEQQGDEQWEQIASLRSTKKFESEKDATEIMRMCSTNKAAGSLPSNVC
jgi:hypothetical protein